MLMPSERFWLWTGSEKLAPEGPQGGGRKTRFLENPNFIKIPNSGRIWTPKAGFRTPDAHPTPAQLKYNS